MKTVKMKVFENFYTKSCIYKALVGNMKVLMA